jgi:DNA-binding XRE family transcriptional regulator
MRPIKEQQQAHARNLYFQSDLTRAQLAQQVGVSEKTIYLWTKQGDWQRLRSGSRLMPSMLVEHFCAQVQELNEAIQSRPLGQRYPTPQEAETQRKLVVTAERIKKKGTQGEYMELMQKFMTWLMPKGNGFVQVFTDLADEFLKENAVAGFRPYDIEYEEPGLLSSALPKGAKVKALAEDSGQPFTDPNQLSLFPENPIPPLKGDSPGSTNVDIGQGDIQPSPATQPNQSPGTNTTSVPSQRPAEAEHETTGTSSLSSFNDEHVMTGNNSNPPYDPSTATFNYKPDTKQEITPTGNNQAIPLLRGDSPGSTNVENGQGCVQLGNEQKPDRKKPLKDTSISIGYIGTQEEVLPDGTTILEIKKEDPGIQKFSVGEAIYYIKKKRE